MITKKLLSTGAALLGAALVLAGTLTAAPVGGKIKGRVVDAQTGEALPGVNVVIEGTTMGAATDIEGMYVISGVAAGKHVVVASIIGYARLRVTEVEVQEGGITNLDFSVQPEALQADEVVIEAVALKNTEASLLKNRQKAAAVSDAISAEAISRSVSSSAADAMEQVTGASVVDGKYVYVRGLGDRYMNTQLNGVSLPSANPDRNTVSLDLFPGKLLDNIVTVKTFTPDKPGNFTGGTVDIVTRSYPEKFSLTVSTATSFNTQTTFKDDFLSDRGGSKDWLGYDDGTRDLPAVVNGSASVIPSIGAAFSDPRQAYALDRASKAFSSQMAPTFKQAPIDQSYALTVGNQLTLFDRPLGILGSLSYSRSLSSYRNGITGQYQLTGKVSEVNELNNLYLLNDRRSTDEVLWGGLVSLSYKFSKNHELSSNLIYNRSGESLARYQNGTLPRDLGMGTFYETRVLQYTERALGSAQFSGSHYLASLANLRVEWTSSLTSSSQDEPDLRYFSNDYTPTDSRVIYSIAPSNYSRPVHYYRNLDEEQWESNLNTTLSFKQWEGLTANLKIGGLHSRKERVFRERRFEFHQTSLARYQGDPAVFFSPQMVGIVDSSNGRYRFGNYIVDASQLANNYDGDQQISAFFAMIDLPLFARLRFIGGARFETTDIFVASQDPLKATGKLVTKDWLPSANFVYELQANMNLRAAYGRTLARPTFRELAPFASFDFVGDFIFVGNPELKRTLVDNYDLRWEWFARPGEIYALSGFYKRFTNPIERAIVSNNNQGQFQNVAEAVVYGAELEVRQRLDVISPMLRNFQLGGNLTLVRSTVDIPTKELLTILQLDPEARGTRELQGQSPYILNLDVSYDNVVTGTVAGLYYNVFGERLSEVSLGGTPNIYEQPRGTLDLTISQRVWGGITVKAGGKNLLDSSVRKVHHFKGVDYVSREHKLGRTFTLGLTYSVE
ncbi:MAG: TonB-dependent receptor [candidate division KSB1 bacterium]|nr:TonB-dependent receptor [candidate division KSB1 bacterium]MDZ7273307.1 TonB-dependent receptor [candidate division KSB1 bacterium]MDZ7285409.1 TonB-dependent receptor [candidate division KSB1 bacterium]MDZ7298441.1 TonB-dependent receptor [candidate division KSB1 bacterium]MDZ7308528.1 TonB-dependent receptor [candidate division KSB1 bacterium]